jgi:hypothetical protein
MAFIWTANQALDTIFNEPSEESAVHIIKLDMT